MRSCLSLRFGLWIGFECSLLGVGMTVSRYQAFAASGLAPHACLLLCSLLIVFTASPGLADDNPQSHTFRPQTIYALIVACVTIMSELWQLAGKLERFGLQISGQPQSPQRRSPTAFVKVFSVTRFVNWTVFGSWCTFTGPFSAPGTGYFAAWGGVLCSILLLLSVWTAHGEEGLVP